MQLENYSKCMVQPPITKIHTESSNEINNNNINISVSPTSNELDQSKRSSSFFFNSEVITNCTSMKFDQHYCINHCKQRSLSLIYAREDPIKVEERRKWLGSLLAEIYDEPSSDRDVSDSLTDTSTLSDQEAKRRKLTKELLQRINIQLIREERDSLETELELCNQRLLRAVRQKAHQASKLNTRCAVVTAILQALSSKTSLDSRLKFSTEPMKGENGMKEWTEAMKAVARLPGGIPDYFRLKLWKTLAENHVQSAGINWKEVQNSSFCDRLQDNDELIHSQIIKDLHRTGWEGFQEEKKLKQLLLAFARYNKSIGYCQGFNIIGALILQVVDYDIPDALKIFIFLIEQVIPTGYFDQSLRALSVDMSVLKDLLHQRLPKTMQHLENLQHTSGNDYEPALTNVFSMHWLLTLFATCLPRKIVYRIWDAVMLEGSEVLLRTALAIWAKISKKILTTTSADQFYDLMEKLSVQLAEMSDTDQDNLIMVVYTMEPFPYPGLNELREKYTWNIQPLSTTFKLFQKSVSNILHDESESDSTVSCSPCQGSGTDTENKCKKTDIQQLQAQYRKLLNRQRQASVILKSAFVNAQNKLSNNSVNYSNFLINNKPVFNHLRISNNSELKEKNKTTSPTLASGAIALTPTMVQPMEADLRSAGSSPHLGEQRRHLQVDPKNPPFKETILDRQSMLKKSKALLRSFTTEDTPILSNVRSSHA